MPSNLSKARDGRGQELQAESADRRSDELEGGGIESWKVRLPSSKMTKMALLLAAMGSLPCCAPFEIGDIEHFLVLVMENRPFDHFYGFASSQLGDIDGLTGEECMPYDPTDPGGESECVAEGEAKYVCEGTGSLSYDTVVEQVFGFNADGTPVWDGVSKYCPNGTSVDVDWCATGT